MPIEGEYILTQSPGVIPNTDDPGRVLHYANVELVQGDTIGGSGRPWLFKACDGGRWPSKLDDYDWAGRLTKDADNGRDGADIDVEVSVLIPMGDARCLAAAVDAETTATLALGAYVYVITGTHKTTGAKWSVVRGIAEILSGEATS